MADLDRVSWLDAEPTALAREQAEIPAAAPDLEWVDAGGWLGYLPLWPFDRPEPPGLHEFVGDRRFKVAIYYPQSYPMVEPAFIPLDPAPEPWQYSATQFHVLPSGPLCLFQDSVSWDGTESAAALIPKAAGWFLEFLLIRAGLAEAMTISGIVSEDSRDHLFAPGLEPEDDPAFEANFLTAPDILDG